MSLLDSPEEIWQKTEIQIRDKESWDKFHKEEIRSLSHLVILIEDFDKVTDEPLRKHIEYALIHLWESSNKLTRSNYFVIFTTSEGDGEQVPAPLKKITGLKWYGNIRKKKL